MPFSLNFSRYDALRNDRSRFESRTLAISHKLAEVGSLNRKFSAFAYVFSQREVYSFRIPDVNDTAWVFMAEG